MCPRLLNPCKQSYKRSEHPWANPFAGGSSRRHFPSRQPPSPDESLRIVSENERQISVLTDPEDSTKVIDISRDDIEDIIPAKISIMPKGLLNPLNRDEVLDLMAYLLSRGDKRSGMFKRVKK